MSLVSVIIPTFNRAQLLPRAIESVLGQDYKEIELIIIDDGSTDDTQELLENYPKIKILRTSNQGISKARNLGIKVSRGEWICFLDSDDMWLPSKLSSQVKYAQQFPHLKLIHTNELWVRNGVRVNQMKKHQKAGGFIFEKCLPLCLISPSTVMIHRSVFSKIGDFDPEMTVCEDYDLWLRITKDYEIGYIEEALIQKYGGHEDQLSKKYKAMDYYRVKSLVNIYNSNLSVQQKILVKEQILKKCEILLRGYKKHNNLENYNEVSVISSTLKLSSEA